jgi:hypothetical protein
MPWCDECAKFWNPASMPEDGTCPSCRRVLVDSSRERRASSPGAQSPAPAPPSPTTSTTAENPYDIDVKALAGEGGKAPWHFKLLVVAIIAYLTWRLVQGIVWFSHWV